MPNLVGENFDKYVAKQVIDRQLIQGKRTRSNEIISYLNSKTSWIKLTSGTSVIDENRLTALGIPKDYVGTKLAENFILFNGTSDTKGTLFAGIDRTNSFVNKYAYGMGGNAYGLRPMPGITSCETKFRNRGSIREGTINIKAWNRVQLEIIDLLYLRLGFPVLLEWGHSIVVNKNGAVDTNPPNYSVTSKFIGSDRFTNDSDLLRTLADKRRESAGNYDAMYGRVVNFNWTFNKNGSYDITLKIISIGAVVESLKMDVYIKDETTVKDSPTATSNDDSQPQTDRDWIVKYKSSHEFGKLFFDIVSASKPSGLSTSFIEITDNSDIFKYGDFLYANKLDKYYIRLGALLDFIQKRLIISNVTDKEKPSPLLNIDTDRDTNLMYTDPNQVASSDPRVCLIGGIRYKSRYAKSPLDILPELSKYPIFDLAFKVISPDYTAQAGRIMNVYVNMAFVIQKLTELKDDGGKVNLYSLISNILSSINKTLGNVNSLELVIDEYTNTALIIDGTPIPNGELLIPEIKKNPNIAEEPPTILAYGYYNNGTENQSAGFVRDISFQTKISNELVSMLSIGATANGTVVGEDATAFSKWNYGLEPVINSKLDYSTNAKQEEDLDLKIKTINEENKLLEESFLKYIEQYKNLNFESLEDFDQYTDLVSRYIEYQQNLQSLFNLKSGKKIASPVSSKGFLPVSLNLTLDGISGVKIYQNLKVDTSFLPQNYPSVLKFLITGVTHRIEKNIWTTSLETISTTITEINNTIPSSTDADRTNSNVAAPSSANREESRNSGDLKTITSGFPLSSTCFGYKLKTTTKTQIYLHHTAGSQRADKGKQCVDVFNSRGVSTHAVIDVNGHIEYCFDDKYQSYHGGAGASPQQKGLSVEIQSYGGLTLKNGKYITAYGNAIPADQVTTSVDANGNPTPYKNHLYWHKLTPAQISATKTLIQSWAKKHNIPTKWKGQQSYDDLFPPTGKLSKNATSGVSGIYTHNSIRLDKQDVFPQPELINMLKAL